MIKEESQRPDFTNPPSFELRPLQTHNRTLNHNHTNHLSSSSSFFSQLSGEFNQEQCSRMESVNGPRIQLVAPIPKRNHLSTLVPSPLDQLTSDFTNEQRTYFQHIQYTSNQHLNCLPTNVEHIDHRPSRPRAQ